MGRLLIQFAGTNTTKALSETLPKNTIIVDEDLHQLRLHDGTTQGGHIIGGSGGGGVPVGTIIPFAGNSIPEGYLLCDGSAISRTDYATLFAVIGTIYGSGDGNSTFNLPSFFTGASIIYGTPGLNENGGVPNITGTLKTTGSLGGDQQSSTSGGTGALTSLKTDSSFNYGAGGRGNQTNGISFDASRISSIYNSSTKVYASGLKMKFVIKY